VDRLEELGVEQEGLRSQLEQAESGPYAQNVDEFEQNSHPITAKMVAETASYYTFIPAAGNSLEMLNDLERLGTVVSVIFSMMRTWL
jgi:hypothetical protein